MDVPHAINWLLVSKARYCGLQIINLIICSIVLSLQVTQLIVCSCLEEISIFLIAILRTLPSPLICVNSLSIISHHSHWERRKKKYVWISFIVSVIYIISSFCIMFDALVDWFLASFLWWWTCYAFHILCSDFECEHCMLLYWNTNGTISKPLSWKPGCEASIPSFSFSLFASHLPLY